MNRRRTLRDSLSLPAIRLLPILLLVPGSCSLLGTSREILVRFPEIPEAYVLEDGYWCLSWLGEGGTVESGSLQSFDRRETVVSVPKEQPVILRAELISGNGECPYRPAGFLVRQLPSGARQIECELRWEDGFSADYLLALSSRGLSPSLLNVDRFAQAVRERSEGTPWYLDTKRLSGELLAGELWIYSFRLLDFSEIVLPLPAGDWYTDYPPGPVMSAGAGGWTGRLPPGTHRFHRPADAAVRIVTIGEDGRFAIIRD